MYGYDIHITVKGDQDKFVRLSTPFKYKPLLIRQPGSCEPLQLVTGYNEFFASDEDAHSFLKIRSSIMRSQGFQIIREKIEKWGIHKGLYYESHVKAPIGYDLPICVTSQNLLSKTKDDRQFYTIRSYKSPEEFKSKIDEFLDSFKVDGHVPPNVEIEIETAIFDTNVKIDDGWV